MTNRPVGSGTTEDTSTVRHGDVSLLQRQRQHSCGQQLRLPPRAAQQQHVQHTLSSNTPSAPQWTCGALDLLSRMRAAVHDDKAHSDTAQPPSDRGAKRAESKSAIQHQLNILESREEECYDHDSEEYV